MKFSNFNSPETKVVWPPNICFRKKYYFLLGFLLPPVLCKLFSPPFFTHCNTYQIHQMYLPPHHPFLIDIGFSFLLKLLIFLYQLFFFILKFDLASLLFVLQILDTVYFIYFYVSYLDFEISHQIVLDFHLSWPDNV